MIVNRRNVLQLGAAAAAASLATTTLGLRPAAAAAKVQRLVSPGGIEAWFVQDATVPLIAMEYAFDGGSAEDPAGKPGVGNMVASLLDEGAGDLDSSSFHDRLERRAIQMSFSDSRDNLRGSMRMLTEHRDEAFGLLRLALSAPRFDAEPVARIRSQILSGLRRNSTNPSSIAGLKFWAMAFGDHPYGRAGDGTPESVAAITVDDLKAYTTRVLARDTLKVAVVGDVEPEALGVLLDKAFGALPAKGSPAPVADVVAATPPKHEFVTLDVPQTVIVFGGPGIGRHDPDFMAGYVVSHILGGGGLTSRLYREVREKRGLAYSVSLSLTWMQHSAMFVGSTATRADRANETLETLTAEVARMGQDGPTQKELDEAKSYLKGSQMLSLDTSSKFATALLQYRTDGLPIDYIDIRNGIVDAVNLEQAKRAAHRLFADGLLTVVVGRKQQAEAAVPQTAQPPEAN